MTTCIRNPSHNSPSSSSSSSSSIIIISMIKNNQHTRSAHNKQIQPKVVHVIGLVVAGWHSVQNQAGDLLSMKTSSSSSSSFTQTRPLKRGQKLGRAAGSRGHPGPDGVQGQSPFWGFQVGIAPQPKTTSTIL